MLLSVQELKTYFYTTRGCIKAVDDVKLHIDKSESVGLVGESGCGKSTVASSILQLVAKPGKIVGGRILYKGNNILEYTEERMSKIRGKEISIVFQNPTTYLNPVKRIESQLTETIMLYEELDKKEAKIRAIDVLEMVSVKSPSTTVKFYPHELSGGMQQRVLIALALVSHPSLLILDEATSFLDVTTQRQIIELIEQLKRDMDISLLIITHDLSILARMCDRIYVMYSGKIVENANTFSLFERPLHPYMKGLLNCVMPADKLKENLYQIPGTVPNPINLPIGCLFHPRCTYATDICHKQKPSSIKVEKDHEVYCFLYSNSYSANEEG